MASVHQHAFTLFEVALSLLLVTLGVTSVLMLFPIGIRAQQMARLQLYASAKANEMMDVFNASNNQEVWIDQESNDPWNIPVAYHAQDWDLENRLANPRNGLYPVPLVIARRLDSEGDEIQNLLSDGGYIYYAAPQASLGLEEMSTAKAPSNEAQQLVIGITGMAQQNSLPAFPWKNWPYVAAYPSPPIHGERYSDQFGPPGRSNKESLVSGDHGYAWPSGGKNPSYCFEAMDGNVDPDIKVVWDYLTQDGKRIGYFPYACGYKLGEAPADRHDLLNPGPPRWQTLRSYFNDDAAGNAKADPVANDDRANNSDWPRRHTAVGYVRAACWYAKRKGVSDAIFNATDLRNLDFNADLNTDAGRQDAWKEVQAMRFLSHAATCLTSWFPAGGGSAGTPAENLDDGGPGVGIPATDARGFSAPDVHIHQKQILYWHDRCLHLVMRYAASLPYDWGAPRPLQRSIMMDVPLMQADLFTPPLSGTLYQQPSVSAAFWKVLTPQPVTNSGVGYTYPKNPAFTAAVFGNPDHFTLTRPFAAAERCREIVFWAADWKAYEDCETAPSAPIDAARFPIAGPWANAPMLERITYGLNIGFAGTQLWNYRNPELPILMIPRDALEGTEVDDPRNLATGASLATAANANTPDYLINPMKFIRVLGRSGAPDCITMKNGSLSFETVNKKIFQGWYGADRNFNKVLDRGPVPASVRMHAKAIARFSYYDPRVPAIR